MARDEVNTNARAPSTNFDVLKRAFIGEACWSPTVPNGRHLPRFEQTLSLAKLVRQKQKQKQKQNVRQLNMLYVHCAMTVTETSLGALKA